MTETPAHADRPKRRRSDAERSVQAILAAALDALASDPAASMAAIARRAGVVRATIYVHFPTRESLLDAAMDHALTEVAEAIRVAEPARGEPREALRRLLAASWRKLDGFHALVAVNTNRLSAKELHRRHVPVIEQLAPLLERGKRDGVFRSDVPIAWQLSMILAIVHAASGELRSGRISAAEVETALLSTVLAAVSPPPNGSLAP